MIYGIIKDVEDPSEIFSEGVSYGYISTFGENSEFEFYSLFFRNLKSLESLKKAKNLVLLSNELCSLLVCARLYPPAWVMAINKASRESKAVEDFADCLRTELELRLSSQDSDPYFLAKAIKTDGEIIAESFYWIIGYKTESNQVNYISTDYQNYWNTEHPFNIPEVMKLKFRNFNTTEGRR